MTQSVDNTDAATGLLKGTFGIGTFAEARRAFPGLVRPDGAVIDLSDRYHDTHAIFDDWPRSFDALVDIAAKSESNLALDNLRCLPPLAHPNILGSGSNYKQHVAEMMTKNKFNQHNRRSGETDEQFFQRNFEMMEVRQREGVPFLWAGMHSSLTGAYDDIILPFLGEQHDWELELGVVIGGSVRYATIEEAQALVAGYVVVNDLGSVDQFRRTDVAFQNDWIGKHQPTFKPSGPFIVPAPFLTLADEMRIKLRVNGEVKQDWPVTDMIFSPARILAYASERLHLMPGDLMITGSPPGNGGYWGQFLKDGDVIDGEITYLGRQRNRCVAEPMGNRRPMFGYWKNGTWNA
jgi:2-keto-4-pentenoate hydratase/2-oxohepta-3-ene-1,7-dioic acid hydratase in catechol pathway